MDVCCQSKTEELTALRSRQRWVLVTVLSVNAVMFCIEFIAGWLAGSTALLADSLDMLGDTLVYGFSLFVLWRDAVWRARAALVKGVIMLLFGVGVLVDAVVRLQAGAPPLAPVMALIGGAALLANALCFALLWRHRTDDINFRSTWLCSRNDLVANSAVLAAAALVGWSGSLWPDLLVGVAIAGLFLRTARGVLSEAVSELADARRNLGEAG
ncbi:MAG: cation transporter [Pseudomonadota bacterium]|nr:cation transporter [Pseudomonadota bacterium]